VIRDDFERVRPELVNLLDVLLEQERLVPVRVVDQLVVGNLTKSPTICT
jgi:hypothetical protein